MLFQLVVEPLVVSERWSCRDCLRQGMCHRTDLPKGVAVRPEELDKFFRPLLACIVFRCYSFGFYRSLY
jgi:hypothetical protein